jgi:DNA (cytosine-5)-methyltransferase 1
MNFLSLFAGVGGFDLAAHQAGIRCENHFFSEADKYASDVFQKRFPGAVPLRDVRGIDYGKLPAGEWLVCGGPPCQPFSQAGKRLQDDDPRNMWPWAVMAVRRLRPRFAIFENVYGVLEYLDGAVLPEIESEGYKTETVCIPAFTVGKNHVRMRWFIIAYPHEEYRSSRMGFLEKHPEKKICGSDYEKRFSPQRSVEAARAVAGKYYGLSGGLGEYETIGNAIVPQCAELIFNLPVFDKWRMVRNDEG